MNVDNWIDEIVETLLTASDCSNEEMVFLNQWKVKQILEDKCSEICLTIE